MRYCIQPATSTDVALLALATDPDATEWGSEADGEQTNRLLNTCASSTQVWAAHDRAGTPQALWGVTPKLDDRDVGCLWMLACEQLGKAPEEFRELSGLVLGEILSEFPRLENFVDARKERAIELLRSIGFTVEPPATHLPSGKLCHLVWIEAGSLYSGAGVHTLESVDRSARLN
jgi:hypothetical protein